MVYSRKLLSFRCLRLLEFYRLPPHLCSICKFEGENTLQFISVLLEDFCYVHSILLSFAILPEKSREFILKMGKLLWVLGFYYLLAQSTAFRCIFDDVNTEEHLETMKKRGLHQRATVTPIGTDWKPISIHFNTSLIQTTPQNDVAFTCYSAGQTVTVRSKGVSSIYTCQQADVLTTQKEAFLNTLLTESKTILESFLKVRVAQV